MTSPTAIERVDPKISKTTKTLRKRLFYQEKKIATKIIF